MGKVPHADGLIEADCRPTLLDEELDPLPASLSSRSRHSGHQLSRCTRSSFRRDDIKGVHDSHRLATPACITAKERDETDGFLRTFGDKGFEERVRPEAVIPKALSGCPWSLPGQVIVDQACNKAKNCLSIVSDSLSDADSDLGHETS